MTLFGNTSFTPLFSPNIGGVESHLDDLVAALDKREYKVFSKDIERATQRNYRMEKLLEENTSYFWMPT